MNFGNQFHECTPALLTAIAKRQKRPAEDQWSSLRIGYSNGDEDGEWIERCRVDDAIDDHVGRDVREEFKSMLAMRTLDLGRRPAAKDRSWVALTNYVSKVDFVCALIFMERIGLAVDPTPWINLARPSIVKKKLIDLSELAIYWYRLERGKLGSVVLGPPKVSVESEPQEWVTTTGYRVEAEVASNGEVFSLAISRPSRRPSRYPALAYEHHNVVG